MTMPRKIGANACSTCARSKRKCGRQMPACARCLTRGETCIYSTLRSGVHPRSEKLMPAGSDQTLSDRLFVAGVTSQILADDHIVDSAIAPSDCEVVAQSFEVQRSGAIAHKSDWFLAPDTWRIRREVDDSTAAPATVKTMKKYTKTLQSWSQRWVTTGSNPVIHARLYSASFPACVQIAYATLTSYIHRTTATTDIILQFVEDRSADLLRENEAVPVTMGSDDWTDGETPNFDLFTQLARLHALIVYQIIGLFDGDIRARYIAEGHMAVLISWSSKLLNAASKVLSDNSTATTQVARLSTRPLSKLQQHWYLWVLSESVRRTWLIAASLSPIYLALQQHWAPCPGSITYTNRNGLWDATSATEWEMQCLEKNVAFLQRFECAKLFSILSPEDIDEFGIAMMEMTFDGELLEQWKTKSDIT